MEVIWPGFLWYGLPCQNHHHHHHPLSISNQVPVKKFPRLLPRLFSKRPGSYSSCFPLSQRLPLPSMPSTEYRRLSTSRDDDLDDISSAIQDKYVPPKKKNSLLFRASAVLAAILGLGVYTAAVLYYAQEYIHKPYCPRFAANDTVHLWVS